MSIGRALIFIIFLIRVIQIGKKSPNVTAGPKIGGRVSNNDSNPRFSATFRAKKFQTECNPGDSGNSRALGWAY